MMRKVVVIFCSLLLGTLNAQKNQVLYDFAEIPQTLLLNPAATTNYKWHVGVPALSGFSLEVGSTGVVLSDLFLKDNVDFTTKFKKALDKITSQDYISVHTQVDIVNVGYRYNKKWYFNGGFYQELDAIFYTPKDLLTLFYEGNSAYINKSFSFAQIIAKADLLGVLHMGASMVVNKNLTVGTRFKVYSSSLNLETNYNSGSFTTQVGENNLFIHYLNKADITLKTSGLIDENDEFNVDEDNILKNAFLGSNLGFGLDFGISYQPTNQTKLTASLLDIGFVNHSENINTYTVKGSYAFDGVNFKYNSSNPNRYWNQLDKDLNEKVKKEKNNKAYKTWRPAKFFGLAQYSFGRSRLKKCYAINYREYFNNIVGLQLYNVFRPQSMQTALTAFYQRNFRENFQTKFTYTIDNYSLHNIGFGLATKIGIVNVYGMVDNVIQFSDIASANNTSFQLGINIIID